MVARVVTFSIGAEIIFFNFVILPIGVEIVNLNFAIRLGASEILEMKLLKL